MRDLWLAIRLVRGAGRRDVTRLAVMAAGIALTVVALLVAHAIPRAMAAGVTREDARTPIAAEHDSPAAARWSSVQQLVGDRLWTQFTVSGVTAATPLPPGLSAYPDVGSTTVSPALAAALATDPALAAQVGPVAAGTITATGLRTPDELVSYRVIPAGGAGGTAIAGFGVAPGELGVNDGGAIVTAEVLVLTAVPAGLFLSVLARLSVASRLRRLRSLRLLGVSRDRSARIFGRELGVVALVGALLGVIGYRALQPTLAGSGAWASCCSPTTSATGWRRPR